MFRTLIYPSSGACDCVDDYHIGRLVLSSLCVGAFVAVGIWWCSFCRLKLQPAQSQALEDGYINVRNMFST